jgi:hypothetical protein
MIKREKIMKQITIKLVIHIVLLIVAITPAISLALHTESPVTCIEGSEPIQLTYGDHTVDCGFELQTDLDRFQFHGVSGDQIRINVISTGGHVDPAIEVRDPEFNLVGEMVCINHLCTYSLELTLAATGIYTIYAEELDLNEIGYYTLQIEKMTQLTNVTPLEYDLPQDGVLTPYTDIDFYTFNGMVDSVLRFRFVSTGGHVDPTVEIRDPSGNLLVNGVTDGATCINHMCNHTIDLPPLTVAGTYSLSIYDAAINETGYYQFNLWCLGGPCDTNGDGIDDPPAPLISYVTPIEESLSHYVDVDQYTFNATADTELRFLVLSTGGHVDPTIEIRDPDGFIIVDGVADGATCTNHLCNYSLPLSITPADAGVYTLLIHDDGSNETGYYQVALWCIDGDCDSDADGITDGDHTNLDYDDDITVTFSPQVDSDIFRFSGTTGDRIRLNVVSTGGHVDPTVEIRDPDGMTILNGVDDGASCVNHGCTYSIDLDPLSVTGIYSLLIYDAATNESGYASLGLQCLLGTCANLAEDHVGDNCITEPNGPAIPDAGGNSQLDTDGDGIGNICDPDFNNNNSVDPADFSQLRSVFGTLSTDEDLNGNGFVDPFDFSQLQKYFGSAPGPSCPTL